jgi:hypothetical protein
LRKKAPPCGLARQCASACDGKLLQVQRPPEQFSLPFVSLLPWVEAEVVLRSYRFKGIGKLRPA